MLLFRPEAPFSYIEQELAHARGPSRTFAETSRLSFVERETSFPSRQTGHANDD